MHDALGYCTTSGGGDALLNGHQDPHKYSFAPNRDARLRDWKSIASKGKRLPPADTPTELAVADIHEAPSLFKPRFESIGFALGRSEAHIAELARVLKTGTRWTR